MNKIHLIFFVFTLSIIPVFGGLEKINQNKHEDEEILMITDIVKNYIKNNGWNTILVAGKLPDSLFNNLKELPMAFSITDPDVPDVNIKNIIPYQSNTIIISFPDLDQFEKVIRKVTSVLYWHPLANIVLIYHGLYNKLENAKIFFILWHFKGINVIIVQKDVAKQSLIISSYNPFMSEHFKFEDLFGCWTTRRVGSPIKNLRNGFECVRECHNISLHSFLRANNLGTCLGVSTNYVPYRNFNKLSKLDLFEDKIKNLHGFNFRGISVEVLPFLKVRENSNGTFTLESRDGTIWNVFAEYLNCTMDLSSAKNMLKNEFNYETNIQQLFAFSQRKADLLMFPVYQFDLIVAQVDYTFPFADSGVCFITQRAGFEMTIFDARLFQNNVTIIVEFFICFVSTWLVFFLFNKKIPRKLKFDQAGKDLMNTCKLVLCISIRHKPKHGSFRIFLAIAIWSFFVINFSTQAAIISLFSVYKRGKNIDTFEDVLDNIRNNKRVIEGIPSPDVTLPSEDERVNIVAANLKAKLNIYECINNVKNDSRKICLTDCTVGRYLERSLLNERGHQYLHVAEKDRIHSLYLNMLFQRHSPLTEHYNKYIMAIFEAGIIKKWTQYKYHDVKDEIPVKVLDIDDFAGIFEIYLVLIAISFIVFIIEVCFGGIRARRERKNKKQKI